MVNLQEAIDWLLYSKDLQDDADDGMREVGLITD